MTHRCKSLLLGAAAILLGTQAHAQAVTLSGTVVDAASSQPIPFAVVEIPTRRVGVQATEQGTFVLELPAALAATDSLRATSLGYAPQAFLLPTVSPCRLPLRAAAVALPEAVVRPPGPPTVLGPTQPGERFGFGQMQLHAVGSQGWQIARRFDAAAGGVVQAVRFYVRPNFQCGKVSGTAPFRIRVYAADGPAGAPGTDLLTTSVLTAASGKGWHEVDLLRYQIRVPPTGFYVAMEWLYTNDRYGCTFTFQNPTTKAKTLEFAYGQTLGGYTDESPPLTWNLRLGQPWQLFVPPMTSLTSKGINCNAAIQALIQAN